MWEFVSQRVDDSGHRSLPVRKEGGGEINEEEEEKAGAIQGGETVDVQLITG